MDRGRLKICSKELSSERSLPFEQIGFLDGIESFLSVSSLRQGFGNCDFVPFFSFVDRNMVNEVRARVLRNSHLID